MSTQKADNIVASGANAPAAGSALATPLADSPAGIAPVRSGKWGWIVVGSCMVVGAVLGVLNLVIAVNSADEITRKTEEMRKRGAVISGFECVTETLDWHDNTCDAVAKMCIDSVPRIVAECLAAQDRTALCAEIGNDEKPSQWAYNKCKARGVDRKSKKGIKESCTQAWRALDSWCKSGQKGVAL